MVKLSIRKRLSQKTVILHSYSNLYTGHDILSSPTAQTITKEKTAFKHCHHRSFDYFT